MALLNLFNRNDTKPEVEPVYFTLPYSASMISNWLASKERKEMILGQQYYNGEHDILNRQRTVIDEYGSPTPVQNIPNNRIVNNQYRKMVDQKTNYALGKPPTITTANETYLEELQKIFTKKVFMQLRRLGMESIIGGIAWLYPYYGTDGTFKFRVFPAHEVLPIWEDESHTNLIEALRIYSDNVIRPDGRTQEVTVIERYSTEGIDRYILDGNKVIPYDNEPHADYMQVDDKAYNWTRIPLIPFKYNSKEIPLIRNVKTLQDSLNLALSDFQNNLEEDPRNSIIVLKNYDGTDIPSFRRNLATYGVVKVHTIDGVQGGVEILKTEVNPTNFQTLLQEYKRGIMENGYGFDAKEERMDGDPNQMNIESMYTDIDLDVNGMESEFQVGFEELIWFINKYLETAGKGDFSEEKVEFIFNRDIFINEDAIIDNCVKSVGILSDKTIVARHPWVPDLQRELDMLEEQKEEEKKEMEELNGFNGAGVAAVKNTNNQNSNDKKVNSDVDG